MNTTPIAADLIANKQTVASLTEHLTHALAMIEYLERSLVRAQGTQPSRTTAPRTGRKERDYGPASTRKATRLDAWQIMFGDWSNMKARAIADATGLSRGQVYSILGGYTFRDVVETDFSNEVEVETIEVEAV